MKKVGRFILLCLACSVVFSIIGCDIKKEETKPEEKVEQKVEEKTEKETERPETLIVAPEMLTGKEWIHYNPVADEKEILALGSDQSYSYHRESGEAIGDADVYNTYSYDEKTQTILLLGTNEEVECQIIKVYEMSETRLLLGIDGKVTEFIAGEEEYDELEVYEECRDAFEGSSSLETILKKEGSTLTTAPAFYDGDVKEHREKAREVKVADGATYAYITVCTIKKGEDVNTTWERIDWTEEEFGMALEGGSSGGYVWYNENLEVTKIILYGDTIVEE